MTTTTKPTDIYAGSASNDRQVAARVTCNFTASGSGSYYSRSCRNLAAWVAVYVRDGIHIAGEYPTLRCHRHRAIDERTARNRGWGERVYDPFDATAIATKLEVEKAAKAEAARLAQLREAIAKYARSILNHTSLPDEDARALHRVAMAAEEGTLVVK